MPYKDKEKQKAYVREWSREYQKRQRIGLSPLKELYQMENW